MNSTYSKLFLLVLQFSFLFGNISAYRSASYNDENEVFLEIYKKQCKGDTFMFDIDHAIVTCPHGSCTWGSQGLLKTQFTFGEVSPTAAPTGTPTAAPTASPTVNGTVYSTNSTDRELSYWFNDDDDPNATLSPSFSPTISNAPTVYKYSDYIPPSMANVNVTAFGKIIHTQYIDVCKNGAYFDYSSVGEHCPSHGTYISHAVVQIPHISRNMISRLMFWSKLSVYADIQFDDGHFVECEFTIEEEYTSYNTAAQSKYMLSASAAVFLVAAGAYMRKRKCYCFDCVDDLDDIDDLDNTLDSKFIEMTGQEQA